MHVLHIILSFPAEHKSQIETANVSTVSLSAISLGVVKKCRVSSVTGTAANPV